MKNRPLAVQIWLVFVIITLAILGILAVFYSFTLQSFFSNHLYKAIEQSQKIMLEEPLQIIDSVEKAKQHQDMANVQHIPLSFVNLNEPIHQEVIDVTAEHYQLNSAFLQEIADEAEKQEQLSQRYSARIENTKVFYVIRKGAFNTELETKYDLVSFMWDNYQDSLVKTLFRRLMLVALIAIIICLLGSIALAKYLTFPLVTLEKNVRCIAERAWFNPIDLKRDDEIGKLAQSVESMRKQLVINDENQQTFLQNVSHELKTPVMVIRSYVQSTRDRIYPTGNLDSTLDVIDEEAQRIEKRIRDLLCISTLDYMEKNMIPFQNSLDLKAIIEKSVEMFRFQRADIEWRISVESLVIKGDKEQWNIAMENILDNQLRYANKLISISLKNCQDKAVLRITNDGPSLNESTIEKIFNRFSKGDNGRYGMGLAIAKQVITLHKGDIWAKNIDSGVMFEIELPINKT